MSSKVGSGRSTILSGGAANSVEVLNLSGQGMKVRAVARLSLQGGARMAVGGTLGEVVVAGGAASVGIIVVGGAAVVFTVNYGLNEMIAAQDKYNEAIGLERVLGVLVRCARRIKDECHD